MPDFARCRRLRCLAADTAWYFRAARCGASLYNARLCRRPCGSLKTLCQPMSHAFLILCHRPPRYWLRLAQSAPESRFYLHYDAKADWTEARELAADCSNVRFTDRRIDVRWAGFSMVAATLELLRCALAESGNEWFHLLSGNCVLLVKLQELATQCAALPPETLLLESAPSRRLNYRVRFDTPHADRTWQRSLRGKILTKYFQAADRLLPCHEPAAAGSQWFSAGRAAAQMLLTAADDGAQDFFRRKLCPDEHFFQYLAAAPALQSQLNHIRDNHRYIRFTGSGNHPVLLDVPQLRQAAAAGSWFARKVDDETALAFWREQTTIQAA